MSATKQNDEERCNCLDNKVCKALHRTYCVEREPVQGAFKHEWTPTGAELVKNARHNIDKASEASEAGYRYS